MQSLHDSSISKYYEQSIKQAKAYLQSKYQLTVCSINDTKELDISEKSYLPDNFSPAEYWLLQHNGTLRTFTIIILIPHTFPDTIPKIYLSKSDYASIHPIPHLDHNRFICTRDSNTVAINEDKTGEAVEQLISIAINNIESGIQKTNHADFINEFQAYWVEKTDSVILSLIKPGNEIRYLHVFTMSKMLFESNYILADSKAEVEHWLFPFNIKIRNKGNTLSALYIPIDHLPECFFEKKKDFHELFRVLNATQSNIVERYFNTTFDRVTLITSIPSGDERTIFGWTYPGWSGIKGFRNSHVPLKVRLLQTDYKSIRRINVKRMDKERILKRGGSDNPLINRDYSITIVGCGSLGSYLSMSLARCGISNYALIDKEELEPENVARHLCGFAEAAAHTLKVNAVRMRLTEHFPFIQCRVHSGDVLELLRSGNTEILNNCSLRIIAVGSTAIERRINYASIKNDLKRPIIYIWIEPLGVSGHILYIHPDRGGCLSCCLDYEMNFLYQVTSYKSDFTKKEAGCQTTYTPYSSLDVEHFISVASKCVLDVLSGKINNSKLFTWLGDLSNYRISGYQLNDPYVADSSYSLIERDIMQIEKCPVCGKNE